MLQAHIDQRKFILEQSPFSESFQIVGGVLFNGVFDESTEERSADNSGVTSKVINSRVIVPTLPTGLVNRVTNVVRLLTGITYKVTACAVDTEGIPVIWLYKE